MNRRDCLKGLGVLSSGIAVSGATVSSLARAKSANQEQESTFDRIYKQAWRKKQKKGYDSFLKHLKNNGIKGEVREQTFDVQRPSSDVSTERYFDDQLTLKLKISYDCQESDYVWIDADWSWDNVCKATGHGGEEPHDVIGIYWASTDYSRVTNTGLLGRYTLLDETHGDYNTTGLAVEYEDWNHYNSALEENSDGYMCTGGVSSSMGCKAGIHDPSQSPDMRKVKCEYHHTHSGCGINSVTVDSSGVGFSWDCWSNVDSFEYQVEKGEQNASNECR